MNFFRKILRRSSAVFTKEKFDAEMAEEMREHVERRTRANLAAGMSVEEARYAAQRQFGGVEQLKEIAREERGWVGLELLARDFRFSLRSLVKARGFSVAVILTLALCIGANTAILSTLYSLLLKPLPLRDAGQVVEVHNRFPAGKLPDETVSVSEYLAYREHADRFASVGLWAEWSFNFGEDFDPQRLRGARVVAETFQVLGITPLHGRFFASENSTPGNDKVVVLTQSLWENEFHADPAIVGQTVKLTGESFVVIGIAPRSAEAIDARVKLFKPFEYQLPTRGLGAGGIMLARLKPGVARSQALAQIESLARGVFEAAGPEWRSLAADDSWRIELVPVRAQQVDAVKTALFALQAAGLFVLLLGCANVANLMLARAHAQLPELALRQALGASRGALVRRWLIDALLLSFAGAASGVALAWGGLRVINIYLAEIVATSAPVALDRTVLAVTALASVVVALLVGLLPVWRLLARAARSRNVSASIQASSAFSTGNARVRATSSLLVTAQVALALVLLVGAGLLMRSFVNVTARDAGIQTRKLFLTRVAQPLAAMRDNTVLWAFENRLVEKLREISGVERVGLTTTTLLDNDQMTGAEFTVYKVPGEMPEPGLATTVNVFNVMPDFFATMGIRLVEGRDFSAADNAKAGQVVIIDRALAERLFPGRSAVGQKLSLRGTPRPGTDWPVVVGVVENARLRGLEGPNAYPFGYNPALQTGALRGAVSVVLRLAEGANTRKDFGEIVRAKIHEIDPALPILYSGAMDSRFATLLLRRRGTLLLISALAGLALVLAAVGISAVLAYDVSRRTREIGIRSALGATRGQIVGAILREGISKTLGGLIVGLIAAVFLTRYLQSLLYEVTPTDPLALAVVSLLLLAVAVAASWLPARRAARIDPIMALRCE